MGESLFYGSSVDFNIPKSWNKVIGDDTPFNLQNVVVRFPEGMTRVPDHAFDYGYVKEIIWAESITEIGDYAFNCREFAPKSIVFPDNVTYIGKYAFSSSSIENIVLPSKLKTLGESAFYSTSIENIVIPETLKRIPDDAFGSCRNLKNVELKNGLEVIYDGAFGYCKMLDNVVIPDSVTYIGSDAFEYCDNLKNVKLSKNWSNDVSYYGSPFSNCKSLKEITIPEGMTQIPSGAFKYTNIEKINWSSTVTKIGESAFESCDGLVDLCISSQIEKMGNSTFEGCKNLKSVTFSQGITTIPSEAFAYCDKLESINLSSNLNEISRYSFIDCKSLTKVEIPDSVTSISAEAFMDCDSLSEVKLSKNWNLCRPVSYSNGDNIYHSPFSECNNLRTVNIPNGMKKIPAGAFKESYVDAIVIPDTCTIIENEAFSEYDGFDIWIPKSVTAIHENAFLNSQNVTIHGESGSYAEEFAKKHNFEFSTDRELYKKSQLSGTVADTSGVPLAGVEVRAVSLKTNAYVLDSCITDDQGKWSINDIRADENYSISFYKYGYKINEIKNVKATQQPLDLKTTTATKMFDAVYSAPENFEYKLQSDSTICITKYIGTEKEVYIPEKIGGNLVTGIGENAFKYNETIEKVVFPSGLKYLDTYAFNGCSILKEVVFNNNLKYIGAAAFANCKSLNDILIPSCVKEILGSAFSSCTNLVNVNFEDGVNSIYTYAFRNCNIKEIYLPDTIEFLSEESFTDCINLVKAKVPKSWKRIEIPNRYSYSTYSPFFHCHSLTEVIIPQGTKKVLNCAFKYCAIKTLSLPSSVKEIEEDAFARCNNLTTITLAEGVERIDNAFKYCENLTAVKLPSTIKSMESAFSDCTKLKEINVPSKIASIDQQAFFNCTALESVTLNEGLKVIGSSAFRNCTSLKKIKIPDSVYDIGGHTFENCTSLSSVQLPKSLNKGNSVFKGCTSLMELIVTEGVTYIPYDIFLNSPALERVILPESLTNIGYSAFENCSKLKEVKFGNNLDHISSYAFKNCTSLREIKIPDSVYNIGYGAFKNCTSLSSVQLPKSWSSYYDTYDIFAGCTSLKELIIPEGVSGIPAESLRYSPALERVVLPESLEYIKSQALKNCSMLKEIKFGNNLKEVSSNAFENCTSLEKIVFPNSLKSLGSQAFNNCTNLKEVWLPRNFETLGENVFDNCPNLTIYCYQETPAHEALKKTNYKYVVVDAHEHDYEVTVVTPNTCTSSGTLKKTCKVCGKVIYETTQPLGHDYTITTVVPTCTKKGYDEKKCKRCGRTEIINYVDALGHDITSVVIPPTCTQKGYTTNTCNRCGEKTITDYVDALGHDSTSVVTPPTCELQGYTTNTCKRCGTVYRTNYVPALGHKFSEWQVVEEPYCGNEGYKVRICSVCNKQETEIIPGGEHKYGPVKVVEPTCFQQGYDEYVCTVCGHVKHDNYKPKKPHDYGKWIIDKEATVVQQGSMHRECKVCRSAEVKKIPRISVDVNQNKNYGIVDISIVNAQSLKPIGSAAIFVSTLKDGESTFVTDSQGKISIVLPVGKQVISAYANGCLVRNITIDVKNGLNTIPAIGLSSKPVYQAEIKHHQMTQQEIHDAGIDVGSTGNQHIYRYEVNFDYEGGIDFDSIYFYQGEDGYIFGGGGDSSYQDDSSEQSQNQPIIWVPGRRNPNNKKPNGHFYIPSVNNKPSVSIYPVSERLYLIVRGESKWQKEMFDVEMLVVNNSNTDVLTNLSTTLTLPDGLSLADMGNGQKQSSTQTIPDLKGGEQKSVHWYVRGDKPGSYDISANLKGLITPHNIEIDDVYKADNQLTVLAGNALKMTLNMPDAAYSHKNYPIEMVLENVSDITLYNLSHMVRVEQYMEVTYNDGTSDKKIDTTNWLSNSIEEFKPGDKLKIEFDLNIIFESKLIESKLEEIQVSFEGLKEIVSQMQGVKAADELLNEFFVTVISSRDSLDKIIDTDASKLAELKKVIKSLNDLTRLGSKGRDGIFEGIVLYKNSALETTLKEIVKDPNAWYAKSTTDDIKNLLEEINKVGRAILLYNKSSERFDAYDAIRTAISAIPIKFALKDVFLLDSAENTTTIPFEITAYETGVQYFGVSNVTKYINSILLAAMGQYYDDSVPQYLQLIPEFDNPFNKEDSVNYVKATENEIAQFKAKDSTGTTTYEAWVEPKTATAVSKFRSVFTKSSSDFDISCDNKTATTQNGVVKFTGDGTILVTPKNANGGILHVKDTKNNKEYTYDISVVKSHTCVAGEREIIIPPTDTMDGLAIKRCSICGDIMEIFTVSTKECANGHQFGEWKVESKGDIDHDGISSRECKICGFKEMKYVPYAEYVNFNYDFAVKNDFKYTDTKTTDIKSVAVEGIDGATADFTGHEVTVHYEPKFSNEGEKAGKILITRTDNTVSKVPIKIAPASNVLYEENFIKIIDNPQKAQWTYTPITDPNYNVNDNDNTTIGYTDAYKNSLNENGAYTAALTADGVTRSSEDITFSFNGTGIDLFGTCGKNTGTLMVSVKDTKTNKRVKNYMVNTAFNDNSISDNLYQVPIINCRGLSADSEYEVIVRGINVNYERSSVKTYSLRNDSINEAARRAMLEMGYTNEEIKNTEFINMEETIADKPYMLRNAKAVPAETKDMTVSVDYFRVYNDKAETYSNVSEATTNNYTAYMEYELNASNKIEPYVGYGEPAKEIYLRPGSSIAIAVDTLAKETEISARAVTDKAAKMTVGGKETVLNHNTEMYYKVPVDEGIIVISNTGDSMLALANAKSKVVAISEVQKTRALRTASLMIENARRFAPSRFDVELKVVKTLFNQYAILRVKASQDVAYITVNGVMVNQNNVNLVKWGIHDYNRFAFRKIFKKGTPVVFEIVAYDKDENASEKILKR